MTTMRKVIDVLPCPSFRLKVTFDNSETRYFDVTPYLDKGIFKELRNEDYFRRVAVRFDGVAWPNHQDLSPDTLYLLGRSEPVD